MKLKFDTRDKKPKLYGLLALTVIVAAAAAILWFTGEGHGAAISILFDLYFAAALVILICAFIGQIHYNPYSYNTIFYIGFAIFDLFVLISFVLLTVRFFRNPNEVQPEELLHLLKGSAETYIILTFPFLFVFSVALCVSNISLIRHEGKRLVNVLGIILSFLIVAGALALYAFDYSVSGSAAEVMIHDLIVNLLASVYLYFECMLIGVIVAGVLVACYEPEPDKDFLIILGCGLRDDGTPTPLLKGRVDRALAFRQKQLESTGKDLIFVTSGGQGPNEVISESASMKQYLIEQGIPEDRIIEEDRSRDTAENMKFSKEKIRAVDPDGKVAFSTTNYHVFRSGLCARRVKMRAVGMGAKTKWYFWPNASVREFVGLLTEHRGKQAAILGGMIAFYIILTLLIYR